MSKEGLKKRIDENKKKLRNYLIACCSSLAIFVLIRLVLRRGTAGIWHVVGAALGAGALGLAYRCLHSAAEPTYSHDWEIIDAGEDLSKTSSRTGHFKDLLWATVILMVLASITDYAWLLGLVIPGYGCYSVFNKVLRPMMSAPAGDRQESDAERSRRERAEKRAEKRRAKRF